MLWYVPHRFYRCLTHRFIVSGLPKEGRDDRYRVPEYSLIQC